ncbi:MAG: hypothetical protein QW666_01285 [Candidatus Woesearchaeota archaeon]
MINEETKKKIYVIELCIAIILIIALVFYLIRPSITGHVSLETFSQALNLRLTESRIYSLQSINSEPFHITSFRLSGAVVGKGMVNIYLETEQQKLLVYSNIKKQGTGLSAITGFFAKQGMAGKKDILLKLGEEGIIETPVFTSLQEGYEVVEGAFNQECIESCLIDIDGSKPFKLIFEIEPGAALIIDSVSFSVDE